MELLLIYLCCAFVTMIALAIIAHIRGIGMGKCVAIGCCNAVTKPRVFCLYHWHMLPEEHREAMCQAYKAHDPLADYNFFISMCRSVSVIGILEDRITFEDAQQREIIADETYRRSHPDQFTD